MIYISCFFTLKSVEKLKDFEINVGFKKTKRSFSAAIFFCGFWLVMILVLPDVWDCHETSDVWHCGGPNFVTLCFYQSYIFLIVSLKGYITYIYIYIYIVNTFWKCTVPVLGTSDFDHFLKIKNYLNRISFHWVT